MINNNKTKRLKILLIEDNEDDAERIEKSLDPKRYHIINIWNGKKALDFLIKQDNDIDVVLLDKSLQYKNGLEILKETKENRKEYAFIFLTIDNTIETAIEAMKLGALDFLPKSSGFKGLPEMIEKVHEIHQRKFEQKQIDKAIRENEEHLRLLVENTSDNIAITTFDMKAKYIYISPSCKVITGYEPEEMVGKSSFEFIHPKDKKVLIPLLKKYINYKIKNIITGKESDFSETIEFRSKHKSGKWIYVQSTANVIGNQLLFVTRDISERKQSEEEIKQLNRVLRAIRNVNQLITKEKDRDKLITHVCRLLVESRGFTSAWLILLDENQKPTASTQAGLGKEFTVLLEQMENKIFTECSRQALDKSGVVVIDDPKSVCGNCPLVDTIPDFKTFTSRLEYREQVFGLFSVKIPAELVLRKEEKELFGEVANDIAFALHTIEMEEKRVLSEKTLQENHGKLNRLNTMLRLMCDNLPEFIWTKDLQCRFMFVNKSCCEDLLNAKDVYSPIGKTDIFFAKREKQSHPENPNYHTFGKTCTESDKVVLETKKTIRMDEFGNIKGKFVILDVIKSPFWDENGKLIGTVGCGRDVTREREIENERKRTEEKLKKKMNELEIFNDASVDRELIINELRKEINELLNKLGKKQKYEIAE